MRPRLLLPALAGLLVLAACSPTGQQQAAAGTIQLPGERPAPDLGLNVPPDAWAGPGRSATPSSAPTRQ
jgi:hypothetical protein